MKDEILDRIDRMIGDHKASIERLSSFRTMYEQSPEIRDVVLALVTKESAQVPPRSSASPPRPATRAKTAKRSGTTSAIVAVVSERPGIEKSALIDEVLKRVTMKSKRPRKAVAQTYDYLVRAGRIKRVAEQFYPIAQV